MSQYQDLTTKKHIAAAKRSFESGKINKEQLNFLVTLMINREIRFFIKESLNDVIPVQDNNTMTFFKYARNRKLNHHV